MKILVSGGHLTPALAFIDYVQQQSKDYSFVFAGRLYAREKTKQKAKEKEAITKRNIPFIAFDSGKLGQGSFFTLPFSLLKTVQSFFVALGIFAKEKPDLYLSFGTYLSVPLALAAWVMRVPIVVHEQTRSIGFANAIVGRFARLVAVTFPETAALVKNKHVAVTGNPIRKSILQASKTKPTWLTSKPEDKIILIIGGSQGSEIINTTIAQCLPQLIKKFVVIHQCGTKTNLRNYKKELEFQRDKLSKNGQKRYYVHEWITAEDLSWLYTHVHLAVSRAGANTVQELSLRHVPTIYIPLPFSHQNEQFLNAKALADTKQAVLLQQKDLSPEKLVTTILQLSKRQRSYKRTLQQEQAKQATGSKELFTAITAILEP